MKIPIVGPSYQMEARSFDHQRSVNLYPLVSESGTSKEVSALRGTPGLKNYTTLGTGPHRGIFTTSKDRCFAVSGDRVYEIEKGGVSTEIGTLLTQSGLVFMEDNGQQLMITDDVYGYIYTYEPAKFERITNNAFSTPSSLTYMDGYFIYSRAKTGQFFISDLYNGLVYNSLDFRTAENSTDDLVRVIADHGLLWAFGTRTVELYYNSGGADFPFERVGQRLEAGCAAKFTVQKFDNSLIWLGVDERGRGVVWRAAKGTRPQRVSTEAIELKLRDTTDISVATSYVYHADGHIFYAVNVPGIDTTLVYDGSTGLWHERMRYNPNTATEEKHLALTHTFFDNKNLAGNRLDGQIYELDLNTYTDDGEEIHRIRTCPHLHNEMNRVFYNEIHIDLEPGQGLTTGQGSDPKIMMRYSDDGGFTWSNYRQAAMGKKGQYKTRARWNRLGSARDRVFEFRISDPIFTQINGAYVDGQDGGH